MMSVRFDNLYTLGKVVYTTDTFEHQHFSDFLDMYDANFINFKQPVSLAEFKEAEHYLKEFHQKTEQEHLKFKFLENTTISEELQTYLQQEGYELEPEELFKLNKLNFPTLTPSTEIEIKLVTSSELEDLLALRFDLNKEYGVDYAHKKNDLIKEQVEANSIQFLIAYFKQRPAGCVNLISSEDTLEIDDLYVHEDFRNKRIASFLQATAIEMSQDKEVILLAAAEDTPRKMYLKQGYELQSHRLDIFKLID